MLKPASVRFLCLTLFGGAITDAFTLPPIPFAAAVSRWSCNDDCDRTAHPTVVAENDYQTDVDRLVALRSHSLDELLALANELEIKWRQIDWNQYARIMMHVCSEISNRKLNDVRVRQQSEHFALVALSHSNMFLWEYQSSLVGWLGYRLSSSNSAWLRERRQKADLWLQTWQRLERQRDPSFDINDRKSLAAMQVYPPFETGLPVGTPPSAIKDPHLRAKYEAALADNKRKSQRVDQQLPLLLRGPSFKARAEHWLIGCYSQPPVRNAELKRLLVIYLPDDKTRQRILSAVEKNSKSVLSSPPA